MSGRDITKVDEGLLVAARQLHRDTPVVDLHQDTLLWTRLLGYAPQCRHRPWWTRLMRSAPPLLGQADLPRLVDGGVSGVGLGIVTAPGWRAGAGRALRRTLRHVRELAGRFPQQLLLADSAADIEEARRTGRVAGFPVIEGTHCLTAGDLEELAALQEEGLRGVGLVHFTRNRAATPGGTPLWARQDRPLSASGVELVESCNTLGLLLDLAHLNAAGIRQVAELSTQPVVISHTGVAGAYRHWRNVGDEELRAVGERGGCVGIILYPAYLGRGIRGGIERVVAHAEHVVQVAGEDAVALGSDIDGFIPTLPRGMLDVADMPLLTAALLQARWPETRIRKLLGGNALRVLTAVWSRRA